MDDVYEPWVPSRGQRIKIRLSGECSADHTPASDGMTGTVTDISGSVEEDDSAAWYPSGDPDVDAYRWHWYAVDFDHPVRGRHYMIRSDIFAAIEVEPL
jgi:hypothetical protein